MAIKKEIEILDKASANFYRRAFDKLKRQARKGWTGWNDFHNEKYIIERLELKVKQIKEGDYSQCIDAANYLMMIDFMNGVGAEKF